MELLAGVLLTLLGVWVGSQLGHIYASWRNLQPNITERVMRIQAFRRSPAGREILKAHNKEHWAIDPLTYDVKDLLNYKDMQTVEAIMRKANG